MRAYPRLAVTHRQRIAVTVMGGAIAVVLVAVAVVAVANDAADGIDDGDGGRLAVAGEVEERTPQSTDTTFALVPVTGGAALPTTTVALPPPPPPPSVLPAPGTTAEPTVARGDKIRATDTIGPAGQVLEPAPADPPARAVDKARGCNSANDAGWRVVQCGALKREDVVLLWVVESKGEALRAIVLRERTAGQWVLVLAAESSEWSKVGVRGEDISGDGRPDLVFGFRSKAGDKGMDLDVVEAGAVTMHGRLRGPSVSVVLKPAELHIWGSRLDGTSDHVMIRKVPDGWEAAASEVVPRSSVPASMV